MKERTNPAENIVKLRPNVYQIRGQNSSSHVYLIKGKTKNVLIDAGLPNSIDNLLQCLNFVGLQPTDIHFIILTHEHIDHVGCAAFFFESTVITAHALAANKIVLQDKFVMMNQAFNIEDNSFHVDLCLNGETMIELGNYRLLTIHTPGHSSGSICLYEPDHHFLFTGDTIMASGTLGGIFSSGNISDYINSLKRLRNLQVTEFYPGHGRISTTPREDFERAIKGSKSLMEDSKRLFETLNSKSSYEHIFSSARNLARNEQ